MNRSPATRAFDSLCTKTTCAAGPTSLRMQLMGDVLHTGTAWDAERQDLARRVARRAEEGEQALGGAPLHCLACRADQAVHVSSRTCDHQGHSLAARRRHTPAVGSSIWHTGATR